MSEQDPAGGAPSPARSKARAALIRRLADVVSLPSSRVNAFERAMTADLLVQMLREAGPEERLRAAQRLAPLAEIPNSLVRLLLNDEFDVARVLIEDCASLTDADLVDCARNGGLDHRRTIASRRGLSEILCEALAARLEPDVIDVLLRNTEARLSQPTIETIVAASRDRPKWVYSLLRRPELRPSGAYVMFWWAEPDARRGILQRFAVGREVLQEAVGDVFPLLAAEGWSDPLARKALQFIERRQRNRAALKRSRFESLEEAVEASAGGLDRELVREIAFLSGLKPSTLAKFLSDAGGEPIAILFKSTGLSKGHLRILWKALARPETDANGDLHPDLDRVLVAYDSIATDKAQTVLRYWNWALSSALTPEFIEAIRNRDESRMDSFSVPERAAMLVLKDDLGESDG